MVIRRSINYANIGSVQVRCLKMGRGPNLVLLHTLRTRLDIFQKGATLMRLRNRLCRTRS
jgi:hypothetical protein